MNPSPDVSPKNADRVVYGSTDDLTNLSQQQARPPTSDPGSSNELPRVHLYNDEPDEPIPTFGQRLWSILKTALPIVAGVGTLAACLFFPPAALFIMPAVEALAAALPAAVGFYAGFIAFGTITALFAVTSAGLTALLMRAGEAFAGFIARRCGRTDDEDVIPMKVKGSSVQQNPEDNDSDAESTCCCNPFHLTSIFSKKQPVKRHAQDHNAAPEFNAAGMGAGQQ